MHKRHKADPIIAPVAVKSPAGPPTAPKQPVDPPSEEAIRLCAYQKWETAGKPKEDGVRFWVEAEKELMQGK